MDTQYSYIPRFILDLTVESAMNFLLNIISPILLKRIKELTFIWEALHSERWAGMFAGRLYFLY